MERDGARYYGPVHLGLGRAPDPRRAAPRLPLSATATARSPGKTPSPASITTSSAAPGRASARSTGTATARSSPGWPISWKATARQSLAQLNAEMQQAAEGLQFERAAQLRDQIRAAGQIVERQKVVSGKQEDQDVIAFAQDERTGEACVQVFFIRRGKLIGRENFVLDGRRRRAERRDGRRPSSSSSTTKRPTCRPDPAAQGPGRAGDHRAVAARQARRREGAAAGADRRARSTSCSRWPPRTPRRP